MTPKKSKYDQLFLEISNILDNSKKAIEKTINNIMVVTYWQIGQYIVEHEQGGNKRAEYGSQFLKQLSSDLTKLYGKGYSYRNLKLIRKFYNTFPMLEFPSLINQKQKGQPPVALFKNNQKQKGQPPVALFEKAEKSMVSKLLSEKMLTSIPKLNWTHFVRLLSIKDEDERHFYLIETAENSWSKRELDRQINSALYDRLALNKSKEDIKDLSISGQTITKNQDILKDPLVLEFLNLNEQSKYSENDLETALIDNLGDFLLELGKGFSFVARQKRITSGADHYYIDLVFYNRLLSSFILIDLKIGKLTHKDIGQMQMYVNYFDREIKTNKENPTIGIILCKENDEFVVEYTLPKDNEQIFSKEYKLYLPKKEDLLQILEEENSNYKVANSTHKTNKN